jgi:transposase
MVLTVDKYAEVRLAYRDGMGVNDLARTFHHSKRKIQEILAQAEPPPPAPREPRPSLVDAFKPIIDAILAADEQAPPKQRHTASKLFRRLRDEHGYAGGAERVRLYVRAHRQRHVETFIPLNHEPGQRLEADFGHIYVDFPDGRRLVPVLVTTWGYSNCPFALALPTERTEAILHGLVEAFAFYGCVPREVWWDNPKTVAPLIFKGRARGLHERYAALASHYTFEPRFCLVREPQEKPRVEGRVKFCQRDWATPVPQVGDLQRLNVHLRQCALLDQDRTQADQRETIGQRFARERVQALALPPQPFDACLRQPAQVDKYQTVRFDHNRYSVPRALAFQTVTVKGYVDAVTVVAGDQEIARHARSYEQGAWVVEPLHYLAALGRRPAALDHAHVFRNWELPAVFAELRQALEKQHGATAGRRHFVRVLQLLAQQSLAQVEQAIESSRTASGFRVAAILHPDVLTAAARGATGPRDVLPAVARAVQVPPPNLCQFDQLLFWEGTDDHRSPSPAGEGEPETTAAADHARRV